MKFLFTPDIFKYEEEFILEAETLQKALDMLEDEFPFNSLLAVYRLVPHSLEFVGVLKLEEGCAPIFVDPHIQIHSED